MNELQQVLETAVSEVSVLTRNLNRKKPKQVKNLDELNIIKATVHTWFKTHRNALITVLDEESLKAIDDEYRKLIIASNRAISRIKYVVILKKIKHMLVELQTRNIVRMTIKDDKKKDAVPNFSVLVTDSKMQDILINRWNECVKCVRGEIPLAATVMMGGMIEGLLLTKINSAKDKSLIFKATASPKDKNGSTLNLKDWGLKDFIDVAHELKWISKTAKDIGVVIRDYRNYVHPQKEYSHGITISPSEARMLWEIVKGISRELVKS